MKYDQCKVLGCTNLRKAPHVYCGVCGGYAYEMSKKEKERCITGRVFYRPGDNPPPTGNRCFVCGRQSIECICRKSIKSPLSETQGNRIDYV